MKSINILKFESGKVILYPLKSVKDHGSYAIPPYVVMQDISFEEMTIIFKQILDEYEDHVKASVNANTVFFHKDNIKITGIKNTKMLHDKSLQVGVFTKDGKYNITPTVNHGSRRGFLYANDRITIPLNSSNEEITLALQLAFEKSN